MGWLLGGLVGGLVTGLVSGLVTVLVLVAVLRCEPVVANDAVHTAVGVGSDVPLVPLVLDELGGLVAVMVRAAVWGGEPIAAHLGEDASLVHFIGPNIWRSHTRGVWQFLAFVPVDETTTRYYVRTYQRMVAVPGLGRSPGTRARAAGTR